MDIHLYGMVPQRKFYPLVTKPGPKALGQWLLENLRSLRCTEKVDRCCADPNMVIVCDPDCTCNDLATLTATLPPLTTTTPFPTSTALSSSFAQVTSSSVTSIMLTPGSLLPTPGTSPVAAPVSGLTTGAKAGIGVGAAVGGAVIFGLIFWLAWVLRERRKETAKLSPGVDTGEPEWKHDRMREKGGPIDLE